MSFAFQLLSSCFPAFQLLSNRCPPHRHPHGQHQTCWVRYPTPRKDIRIGISALKLGVQGLTVAVTWAAWEACRGYGSYHMGMGCMGGPTHQLATHVRLQISVTPHAPTPVERNGQSGLHILLHRRRLCTQGCPCVLTRSGIIVLTLGTQLSPHLCHDHIFPSCPDFGSAPRAQAAREHRWRHTEHLLFECQCIPRLQWIGLQQLPFAGMTSSGCVLGRTTRRRRC